MCFAFWYSLGFILLQVICYGTGTGQNSIMRSCFNLLICPQPYGYYDVITWLPGVHSTSIAFIYLSLMLITTNLPLGSCMFIPRHIHIWNASHTHSQHRSHEKLNKLTSPKTLKAVFPITFIFINNLKFYIVFHKLKIQNIFTINIFPKSALNLIFWQSAKKTKKNTKKTNNVCDRVFVLANTSLVNHNFYLFFFFMG